MISVAQIEQRLLRDRYGETADLCAYDGYPTNLLCTCGHDHDRHSGEDVRCMSYVGEPDCDCNRFIPSVGSVVRLWSDAKTLLSIVQATC